MGLVPIIIEELTIVVVCAFVCVTKSKQNLNHLDLDTSELFGYFY